MTIDAQKDFISDRGDQVWAILKKSGIEHVTMIGAHTKLLTFYAANEWDARMMDYVWWTSRM